MCTFQVYNILLFFITSIPNNQKNILLIIRVPIILPIFQNFLKKKLTGRPKHYNFYGKLKTFGGFFLPKKVITYKYKY